jgi:hypothetical protein
MKIVVKCLKSQKTSRMFFGKGNFFLVFENSKFQVENERIEIIIIISINKRK